MRAFLAALLAQMGKNDEAIAELSKIPPDDIGRLLNEAIIYARLGNRAVSDKALQRAQQLFGDLDNYQYAEIHSQRGEKEQAFATLDRAWGFRDPGLASMKSDTLLDPLRGDPRFTALLRKMNFPSA
jgi:tetratricopeptide (TPR) repeat protein